MTNKMKLSRLVVIAIAAILFLRCNRHQEHVNATISDTNEEIYLHFTNETISNISMPFMTLRNLTVKTNNPYGMDYTATNIEIAIFVTNQPIIIRTNDAWVLTFKP